MVKTRKDSKSAKLAILNAAHHYLVEGGPSAVKVQLIAKDLGITDAAIHYHFKNRQSLLESLLKYAGSQLKEKLSSTGSHTVKQVTSHLERIYRIDGYAKLAMWLSLEGWHSDQQGMFDNLVNQWQEKHDGKKAIEAKFDIAFLNLVMAAEPLFGGVFLRSVGLDDDEQTQKQFRTWFIKKLTASMD